MKKRYIVITIIAILIVIVLASILAYYIIKENGKKYEVEKVNYYNYFVLKKDNNYGVINTKGKEIIECEQGVNHIEISNDNIIVYKTSETIYYDSEGNKL